MRTRWHAMLLVIAIVMAQTATSALMPQRAAADPAPTRMTVATHLLPPFVMESDGQLTGFTVELWNAIAAKRNWTTDYQIQPGVQELLTAVANRQADVGASAISITAARERSFEFSQPILHGGLQVMVRDEDPVTPPVLKTFFDILFSRAMLGWLLIAIALAVVPANVLWLIERRHGDGAVSKRYLPGILQAFAWSLGMLVRHSNVEPKHWMARTLGILWAFVALIFVAFYTASLTATLTVEQINDRITGPADLLGKRVATVAGTTSVTNLREIGIAPTTMPRIEDCIDALLRDDVDAVVFDAPVLDYYALHHQDGTVKVVGALFDPEDYGFVLPLGSDSRRAVDEALLTLQEDGTYELIKERWFGESIDEQ